ncbi:MAP7 domain-containing protein [Nostoc sp. DedVER01b]|uniref:MAP7 domain-containing protein n=1 Tax=Nostoc sp. DedVER01b TaxID=3075404 RepID=UPI002AD34A35|nr:MAP7 domain-containing protein [Nostoc sp. DedVER01b]MDZ8113061.1 MAP7 domain-containing protein [Nostoc sp. DedVER01b]
MTQSVADKTSILPKDWRRHTDPPSLWIAVVIGSVTLHLLVFWLLRSYQSSLLWRQQNKSTIPIEVVEISSPTKLKKPAASKPKSLSSKPLSTKLEPKHLSKPLVPADKLITKPNPTNQDNNAVAFAEQRQRQLAEQQQRELAEQRQRQLAEQQQRQLAEYRQRQLAEQQQRELAEYRQRQLAEQQQRELDKKSPEEGSQERLPPPKTQSGGGLFAFWVPMSEEEQRGLMRSPLPPDLKLAEHIGSNEKKVESIDINRNLDLPVVDFLVSLVIDNTGKFIEAEVIDPKIPADQRSKYEDYANDVFQGEKFQPAYFPDGKTPPELTNRFVRLKIERR